MAFKGDEQRMWAVRAKAVEGWRVTAFCLFEGRRQILFSSIFAPISGGSERTGTTPGRCRIQAALFLCGRYVHVSSSRLNFLSCEMGAANLSLWGGLSDIIHASCSARRVAPSEVSVSVQCLRTLCVGPSCIGMEREAERPRAFRQAARRCGAVRGPRGAARTR